MSHQQCIASECCLERRIQALTGVYGMACGGCSVPGAIGLLRRRGGGCAWRPRAANGAEVYLGRADGRP